jgi:hypothetical protein
LRLPAAWAGIVVFGAVLAAVEILVLRRAPFIALRMLAVAAAGLLLFRLAAWARLAEWGLARPPARKTVLYFLFLAHFSRIFLEEILSLYHAWKLAAPNRWNRSWGRSLACATASLFPRTLRRAERFYAALLLKGMAQ